MTTRKYHPNETRAQKVHRENHYRDWLKMQKPRTRQVAAAGEILELQRQQSQSRKRT